MRFLGFVLAGTLLLFGCTSQHAADSPPSDEAAQPEETPGVFWPSSAGTVRGVCDVGDASDCEITVDGRVVLEVWHYGGQRNLMAPLSRFSAWAEDLFLVGEHQGDGCPVMYRVLCARENGVQVTDAFGNCGEPDSMEFGETMTMGFSPINCDADVPEPYRRTRQRWELDTETCSVSLESESGCD